LRCGLVKACRCSFPIRQPNTPAIVEESWELQSQDGDSIQLQIRMSVAKWWAARRKQWCMRRPSQISTASIVPSNRVT